MPYEIALSSEDRILRIAIPASDSRLGQTLYILAIFLRREESDIDCMLPLMISRRSFSIGRQSANHCAAQLAQPKSRPMSGSAPN